MIARVVIAALLGVLTWTFLEYVIHWRYLPRSTSSARTSIASRSQKV